MLIAPWFVLWLHDELITLGLFWALLFCCCVRLAAGSGDLSLTRSHTRSLGSSTTLMPAEQFLPAMQAFSFLKPSKLPNHCSSREWNVRCANVSSFCIILFFFVLLFYNLWQSNRISPNSCFIVNFMLLVQKDCNVYIIIRVSVDLICFYFIYFVFILSSSSSSCFINRSFGTSCKQ